MSNVNKYKTFGEWVCLSFVCANDYISLIDLKGEQIKYSTISELVDYQHCKFISAKLITTVNPVYKHSYIITIEYQNPQINP